VPRLSIDEDQLLEIALEAGAEELTTEEDQYVITTSHDQLYVVAERSRRQASVPMGKGLRLSRILQSRSGTRPWRARCAVM